MAVMNVHLCTFHIDYEDYMEKYHVSNLDEKLVICCMALKKMIIATQAHQMIN